MSQYFSRLAERSGVTATSPAAQSISARTNGVSDWNEQTTEITASVSSPVHGKPVVHESQSDHSTLNISANRQSKVLSDTVQTTSQGIQHRVSATVPGMPESTVPATELAESITNVSKKDNNEGRSMDIKAKAQTSIDKTSRVHIENQSEDFTVNDSAVSYSASVSEYVDDHLIEAHDAKSNTGSTEKLDRSKATPSRQQLDKNEHVERISSSPARALSAAATATPAHSSSKSSVQVNIGKIELEIHAPAVAANRAPQPIRTIIEPSPAVSRNTVFNPHRHYLRGR